MASVDPKAADILAHKKFVTDAVKAAADEGAERAARILREHRYQNHSFIEVVRANRTDFAVVLNDERGQRAAMTIEKGRAGGNIGRDGRVVSPMAPVAPLFRGFGI